MTLEQGTAIFLGVSVVAASIFNLPLHVAFFLGGIAGIGTLGYSARSEHASTRNQQLAPLKDPSVPRTEVSSNGLISHLHLWNSKQNNNNEPQLGEKRSHNGTAKYSTLLPKRVTRSASRAIAAEASSEQLDTHGTARKKQPTA